MSNVLIDWVSHDVGMTFRVLAILVDPGVQQGDIYVLDLLSSRFVGFIEKGSGIGASPEERVAGFQGIDDL